MKKLHKKIRITTSGGSKAFNPDDLNSYYHVVGDDVTLQTSLTFVFDGTALDSYYIEVHWTQKVTRDSNTVTFLGTVIDLPVIENVIIRAIYNGSAWVVSIQQRQPSVSNPINDADFAQFSDGDGGFAAKSLKEGDNKNVNWGENTEATGHRSTAFGEEVTASDFCETVFGRYATVSTGTSTAWVETDSLLKIGIGEETDAGLIRKDALLMSKNGNTTVSGIWTFNEGITYDNSVSGLEASTIHSAIDEIADILDDLETRIELLEEDES